MKYMLILTSNPDDEPAPGDDSFGPYMDEWAAYSHALVEAGALDHAAHVDARHDLAEHGEQVCTRERLCE